MTFHMVRFIIVVSAVSSYKQFLIGQKFELPIGHLNVIVFKSHIKQKKIFYHAKGYEQLSQLNVGVQSCVHFCFRSFMSFGKICYRVVLFLSLTTKVLKNPIPSR